MTLSRLGKTRSIVAWAWLLAVPMVFSAARPAQADEIYSANIRIHDAGLFENRKVTFYMRKDFPQLA